MQRTATLLGLIALSTNLFLCVTHVRAQEPMIVDPPLYDLDRVLFRSDHPGVGESLSNAVTKPDIEMWSLQETANFLMERPYLDVEIFGHADVKECDKVNCQELSSRRAVMVHDWLINHGVPSMQLKSHEGLGASQPMDKSETEQQRQNNRRVDFEVTDTRPADVRDQQP